MKTEFDKYLALKNEIIDLKGRVLHRVVLRARQMRECEECGEYITRHQAQTKDGKWHHLSCIATAPSPEYGVNRKKVMEKK